MKKLGYDRNVIESIADWLGVSCDPHANEEQDAELLLDHLWSDGYHVVRRTQ